MNLPLLARDWIPSMLKKSWNFNGFATIMVTSVALSIDMVGQMHTLMQQWSASRSTSLEIDFIG